MGQITEAEIQKKVGEKPKDLSVFEISLHDVQTRYDFVNTRVEGAIVLLARVKDKLPKELKKEVEEFQFPKEQNTIVSGHEKYFEGTDGIEFNSILYKTPNDNYFI